MPRRKRDHDEMETETPQPPTPPSISPALQKIRNMWEFACLNQFIYTFGKVLKVDEDLDIEELEIACLDPAQSNRLEELGLALLKWISSHRGLTLDIWDEYARRQYVAKFRGSSPYGTDEAPAKFREFDIFTKIRVLHQLTVWTLWNPDRLITKMPESTDKEQVSWRIEELGWDGEDRSYFVLDDSRLYRRTAPPLEQVAPVKKKPKSNTLKAQAARRRESRRRKLKTEQAPEDGDEDDTMLDESEIKDAPKDEGLDTFGGYKWECVAISGPDYNSFLKSIEKAKDPDEKALHSRIIDQVLPVVERAEESQRRKLERKQKELITAQKIFGAKRSSRLADKQDRERHERETLETAQKHKRDLAAAHRDQERLEQIHEDRESRRMTREQRKKDRDFKKILAEEELEKMAEEAKRIEAGESRVSERHLKAQIERQRQELRELTEVEEWVFDCSGCGIYGKNIDDGEHSVACEKCSVWQHSKCLGISQSEAEGDDYTFVCKDCLRKEEEAKRPQIKIRFRAGLSSSPPQPKDQGATEDTPPSLKFKAVEIPRTTVENGVPSPSPSKQPVTTQHLQQSQPGLPQQFSLPAQSVNGLHSSYTPSAQQLLNGQASFSRSGVNGHAQTGFTNQPRTQVLNSQPTASTPAAQKQIRVPSPIINRPVFEPTQGNMDVASVAGVSQNSTAAQSESVPASYQSALPGQQQPKLSQHPQLFQNGIHSTPVQVNDPPFRPLSGISPTKNSPAQAPIESTPLFIAKRLSQPHASPNFNSSTASRSISGTPIYPPPAETRILQPGPDQLSNTPVPTPSKPASPPAATRSFD